MLEHTGVLFTYLIALKDDETDRISVSGINSLQCLLKDFPLRIAELKDDYFAPRDPGLSFAQTH